MTPDSAHGSGHHRHDGHGHVHAHGHGHAHGHAQGHAHGHARGHGHTVGPDNRRRVLLALVLTGTFMVAEVVGGLLSGSLALLADAGHMLTDTAALGLSYYAFCMSRRPATPSLSYGYSRIEVLAALLNGGALFGITIWIAAEAVGRLLDPVEILGGPMLGVAVLGLAINVAAFLILHGGGRENMNVRGAALHVLGDLLGSVAAIAAAGVILVTGWTPIDPILSILVALLILRSAWMLVAQAWSVLMEGTPRGLDVPALRRELVDTVPGVTDIHHVHAWSLTPERSLVTLHASIDETADSDAVLHGVQHVLAERFGVDHATIQIERRHCTDSHGGQRFTAAAS